MDVKCVWVSRACTNIAQVLLKYQLLMQQSLVLNLAFCSISMHNYTCFLLPGKFVGGLNICDRIAPGGGCTVH